MAKRSEPEYDPNDPDTWTDSQMNKYIMDKVADIGSRLPWDKIVLATVFTYGHWRAFGKTKLPTKGDIILGIIYAMTIPEALRGGVAANAYALGALGYLGLGVLIPGDYFDKMLKGDITSNVPSAAQRVLANETGWVDTLKDFMDDVSDWFDELPDLTPPENLN